MPQRADAKPFSTRFLSSDGIPEYNALLDEHLGKRREYLLGNKKSLELLQRTGVIARVEWQCENPNQYVVHVAPKTASNQNSHNLRRKRPPSLPISNTSGEHEHEALWRALPPYGSTSSITLRNSATTPDLGVADRMRAMRIHEECEEECDSSGEGDEQQGDKDDLVAEIEMEEKGMPRWQPQHDSTSSDRDDEAPTAARQASSSFADRHEAPGTINDRHTRSSLLNNSSTTSSRVAALKYLGRSRSTLTLVRKPSVAPLSQLNGQQQQQPERSANAGLPALSDTSSGAGRHRSRSVIAISATPLGDTSDSVASKDMLRFAGPNTRGVRAKSAASASSGKTTVEHLLESDAVFASQIRVMKEQLAELTAEKARLDGEIAKVRRKLKGVNAVHENDVAVAHCAAIMQQRLAKAEEEYMKLVTAQQQVKTAVDRVRRELLSLKAVRRKLETDIDDVRRSNAAIDDKIHATKLVRNALSEELTSLERQAEQELEEQKLSLPPEDAVVVDVARLMNAAASVRQPTSPGSRPPPTVLLDNPPLTPSKAEGPRSGSRKESQSNRRQSVDYVTAFKQVQLALGSFTDAEDLAQAFNKTEEQLLTKYRASLELKDELAALEKEQAALAQARAARHATIRGSVQASASAELAMQHKLHALQARIMSYNEIRESRNQEHARLRGVMLRCLEILQAESLLASFVQTLQPTKSMTSTLPSSSLLSLGGSSSGLISLGGSTPQMTASSSTRPFLLSELPSSVMLEALQKKMTEVAMALKVKHSARIVENPEACFHMNHGKGGRRSNMFSTREVSKIVLGPRDPPGSTLAAIMESVQPPSIETALAMTETSTGNSETGANGGRAGCGSVVYPVGEIIIAERKAIDGSSSPMRPLDRAARQRKTTFAQ